MKIFFHKPSINFPTVQWLARSYFFGVARFCKNY